MLGVHLRWLIYFSILVTYIGSELWHFQLAIQHPGLDGQEVSLKLHHDGCMGSFEDSSGKYSLKNNIYIYCVCFPTSTPLVFIEAFLR